jgi:hypothetical protein
MATADITTGSARDVSADAANECPSFGALSVTHGSAMDDGTQSRHVSFLQRLSSTLSVLSVGAPTGTQLESEEDLPEPKFLGIWSATCILVNFISVGYILNPSGKTVAESL